jgi:hypothetical protein
LIRESAQMRIAWREFGPRVANTDHRSSVENMARKPLIAHPTAMNKSVLVIPAEPGGGSKGPFLFRHLYLLQCCALVASLVWMAISSEVSAKTASIAASDLSSSPASIAATTAR